MQRFLHYKPQGQLDYTPRNLQNNGILHQERIVFQTSFFKGELWNFREGNRWGQKWVICFMCFWITLISLKKLLYLPPKKHERRITVDWILPKNHSNNFRFSHKKQIKHIKTTRALEVEIPFKQNVHHVFTKSTVFLKNISNHPKLGLLLF